MFSQRGRGARGEELVVEEDRISLGDGREPSLEGPGDEQVADGDQEASEQETTSGSRGLVRLERREDFLSIHADQ